jgi:hypothetical protein
MTGAFRDMREKRRGQQQYDDEDDHVSGAGGATTTLPEITVTDQNAPLFDLDWLNACADRVVFDKRTEGMLKEVYSIILYLFSKTKKRGDYILIREE